MDPPVYLLLVLVLVHTLSTVSSRRYILRTLCTSSVGLGLAEFTAVVLVDELQVARYDEHLRKLVTTQYWVMKAAEEKPIQCCWQKKMIITSRGLMKNIMEDQKNISTDGVVVLQASVGCEWDSDTNQTSGFLHFSLNAQDFLRFTPETQSWTTEAPEAQRNRDMFEKLTGYWKHYLTEVCPRWLKTLHKHGSRKDGTFQTQGNLDLSQVQRKDWMWHKCLFPLIQAKCERAEETEEAEESSDMLFLALIIILPVLLVLGGPAAVFFIDRRRESLRNTEESEPPKVELQLSIHQSRDALDLFKQA